MNLIEALKQAEKTLIENDIESARLEAEILLAHILNKNRLFIYVNPNESLNDEQVASYQNLISRRALHEPTAYLINHREFMNLDLLVTNDVLIPRPETEILVETVINRLKNLSGKIKIADIGTGSGAIALSILHILDNVEAVAIDISEASLEVAKNNANRYNLSDRIIFQQGDLLNPLIGQKFNAIVSNPPYIQSNDIEALQIEVAKYEPRIALDGGVDGLDFYRRLIEDSPQLLLNGGFLAIEIGHNQAEAIKQLAKSKFNHVEIFKDLSNHNRIVVMEI